MTYKQLRRSFNISCLFYLVNYLKTSLEPPTSIGIYWIKCYISANQSTPLLWTTERYVIVFLGDTERYFIVYRSQSKCCRNVSRPFSNNICFFKAEFYENGLTNASKCNCWSIIYRIICLFHGFLWNTGEYFTRKIYYLVYNSSGSLYTK
jgi:hypothetical protein